MSSKFIILSSFPIAIAGYAIYYLLSIIKRNKKYQNIPSVEVNDGILGLIFGHLRMTNERRKRGVHTHEQHFQDFEKLKTKTMRYRMLTDNIVVTRDPNVIKAIIIEQNCLKDEKFRKLLGYPLGERLGGNGLITETNYERWKHKRSLLNPGFQKQALKSFMKEFNSKTDILMQHLRAIAESKNNQISLLEKFNKTALDVIASVAFSMNIDSINDPNNEFNKHIFHALDGITKYSMDPFVKLKVHRWQEMREYRRTVRKLRSIGQEQIEKRLEMIKNGEPLPDDILTTIFKSHENEEFSVENLVDNFITFFNAGQETTANTLASAFLEIGRHPEILKKLRDEVDTVLGSKTEMDFDDLSKLKYTGCVFKETLRLYPPGGAILRVTKEDIESEGITIPKGSLTLLSIYSCGRTEEFFPDPFTFNPDRFLNEEANIKNYTYFPFSLGARNCIGQNFAKIEAKLIMAKFIQNFDFILDKTQSFDLYQAVTLRPKDGTKGTLFLR